MKKSIIDRENMHEQYASDEEDSKKKHWAYKVQFY